MGSTISSTFVKVAAATVVLACTAVLSGGEIRMTERAEDPHGVPRPARDARNVPLDTSFFFKLVVAGDNDDTIATDSLRVRLEAQGHEPIALIGEEGKLADGVTGWVRQRNIRGVPGVMIHLDPGQPLAPDTRYTVHVNASSRKGIEFTDGDPLYLPSPLSFRVIAGPERARTAGPDRWHFTTAERPRVHTPAFTIDLDEDPVHWHGAFFSGICNVVFCTQQETFGPTYELMHEARRQHPHAWSFQRDFWLTGTQHRPNVLSANTQPNIVAEMETRRITAIDEHEDGLLLHLEDVFGHRQYGIESNRPLSEDYEPGHKILLADGHHDARAEVLAVDDDARTVLVSAVDRPAGGWQLQYTGPLPEEEDPDAPGLFPPGGCYLYRFDPVGTPVYFWERLNKEWDMVHGRYGRRVMPNFVDAPSFISITGRGGYAPKDYVQWHEVVRTITGHLVDRYGDASLDFVWSVFNEPDLNAFWRQDPHELLRFYDYTADAILRAFEDRGYDSNDVFIGGLEIGGIFGTNLSLLHPFLVHCSPAAVDDEFDTVNAAFADERLEGLRSRRVEKLCAANEGRGSPVDFVSIHLYNASKMAAAKLFRAKEMALEIDEAYYRDLWVNSHEACPDWAPPPDPAVADAYLGNGYFKTWSIDLVARQLRRAAGDPRYAYGETIMTVWPPLSNLQGLNAVTRRLGVDATGDGRADSRLTIAVPVFHVLTLLSDLRDDFHVLPDKTVDGHVVSGFASTDDDGTVRLVLYAHQADDTQSRSRDEFDVTVDLRNLHVSGELRATEYRFDRRHNSYFQLASKLRETQTDDAYLPRLRAVLKMLAEEGEQVRDSAARELEAIATEYGHELFDMFAEFVRTAADTEIRQQSASLLDADLVIARNVRAVSPEQAERFQQLATLEPTSTATLHQRAGAPLELTARIKSNGVNFIVISPGGATESRR